jgi:hypothetical protein
MHPKHRHQHSAQDAVSHPFLSYTDVKTLKIRIVLESLHIAYSEKAQRKKCGKIQCGTAGSANVSQILSTV